MTGAERAPDPAARRRDPARAQRRARRLEVQDTGKPIAEAITVDVASGADCIEFFAAAAATLHGEYLDLGGCVRLHAARAARRLRRDRRVELPDPDRVLEVGARRWPAATRWCSSRRS